MANNILAEQMLLGLILQDNEIIFALPTDFTAELFYEPVNQRIFAALADAVEKGQRRDAPALAAQFEKDAALEDIGGSKYLFKLASSAFTAIEPKEYAEVIAEMAARRRVIVSCEAAIKKAHDIAGEQQAAEIVAGLCADLEQKTADRFRVSSERQVTERIVSRMANRKEGIVSSTGFPRLDKAMQGGLFQGKLYGIVGRKKMGKTMFAGTVSTALQDSGTRHLYIALEMGSDEIQQRTLAQRFGCYDSAFRTDYSEVIMNRVADYAVSAKSYRLYLDAAGISFTDLRRTLPQLIRKHKLQGFILDCWQLVGGKAKGQSTAEHLDAVAQWLAECVKKHQVWGIVTAQENQDENTRGGEGIRLACDQLYRLCKNDETSTEAWLEMMETRYTKWDNIGKPTHPAYRLHEKFTHFIEY